jgi:hypothetical protein
MHHLPELTNHKEVSLLCIVIYTFALDGLK